MAALARSLHLGSQKSGEFAAHVHIIELQNVPLVEGECKVKWKFKNNLFLNSSNGASVVKEALDTANTYSSNNGGSGDKGKGRDSGSDDDGREHPRLPSLGKALFPKSSVHGGSSSHSSIMERRGTQSMSSDTSPHLRSSRNGRRQPDSDFSSDEDANAGDKSTSSNRPSFVISSPSESKGELPTYQSQSPPSRLHSPSTIQTNNHNYSPSPPPAPVSRVSTRKFTPTDLHYYMLKDSVSTRPPATVGHDRKSSYELSQPTDLPTKVEPKGSTGYTPLNCATHSCVFDQHVICAVSIPVDKKTNSLLPSPVRLSVRYKVRVSPIPLSLSQSQSGGSAGNLSYNSPSSPPDMSRSSSGGTQKFSSMLSNAKEEHEELHLGEVYLDLSEFVLAGIEAGPGGKNSVPSDLFVCRRYLLTNGRTNALLKIGVRMDWIGGERSFKAPFLKSGQVDVDSKGKRKSIQDRSKSDSSNPRSSTIHNNSSARSLVSITQVPKAGSSQHLGHDLHSDSKNKHSGRSRSILRRSGSFSKSEVSLSAGAGSSHCLALNQNAADLIEAIFANAPGMVSKFEGDDPNACAEVGAGPNAKAQRDANPSHDPNHPPHSGYHRTLNHHLPHHNKDDDEKVLVTIPTPIQGLRAASGHQIDLSQPRLKLKRYDGLRQGSHSRSGTATPSNLPKSASTGHHFFHRPLLGSRTHSTSSLNSAPEPRSTSRAGTTGSVSGPGISNVRASIDSYASLESSASTGSIIQHGDTSVISIPQQGQLGGKRSVSSLNPARNLPESPDPAVQYFVVDGDLNVSPSPDHISEESVDKPVFSNDIRASPNASPNRSIGSSGTSSPVRAKGVRWEDAAQSDKEYIDKILSDVVMKQSAFEKLARSNSGSDIAGSHSNYNSAFSSRGSSPERNIKSISESSYSRTSRRTPSPEKSKSWPEDTPAGLGDGGDQCIEQTDEDQNARSRRLRERGLLPSVTINGLPQDMDE